MEMTPLNALLAKNIESLLKEKGLNASAWAKDAKMGHTGVRDIILGKVKNPTYNTLVKLAAVAKVDVRRITVGPNYSEVDDDVAEAVDLLSQLEPVERQLLLNTAKSQIASRDIPLPKPDAEDQ